MTTGGQEWVRTKVGLGKAIPGAVAVEHVFQLKRDVYAN